MISKGIYWRWMRSQASQNINGLDVLDCSNQDKTTG